MTTAGLVTVEGDQVKHLSDVLAAAVASAAAEIEPETTDEESVAEDFTETNDSGGEGAGVAVNGVNDVKAQSLTGIGQSGPRAVFNVNVTLDSSLDIEKLQKQLEVLKRFGAI